MTSDFFCQEKILKKFYLVETLYYQNINIKFFQITSISLFFLSFAKCEVLNVLRGKAVIYIYIYIYPRAGNKTIMEMSNVKSFKV